MNKLPALWKDYLLEILNSKSRFISILVLLALGTFVLDGLTTSGPIMRASMDEKLMAANHQDISLDNPQGLDSQDRALLRDLDGVSSLDFAYVLDLSTRQEDLEVKVQDLPQDLAQARVLEGRMPQEPGEIALYVGIRDWGYDLGDRISFNRENSLVPGSDEDPALERYSFKIVGLVQSTEFIDSNNLGTTSRGGSLDSYGYILREDFLLEDPTRARLAYEDLEGLPTYSDEFKDRVGVHAQDLESALEGRADERLKDTRIEIKGEIEEGEAEIQEAKDQIQEGREALAQAFNDLLAGDQEYKTGRSSLMKALLQGQRELEAGKKDLDAAGSRLAQAELDLARGRSQVREGQNQLGRERTRLEDGRAQYKKGQEDYLKGLEEFEGHEGDLRQGISLLDIGKKDLLEAEAKIIQAEKDLDKAEAEIAANLPRLRQAQSELESGRAQLEAAQKEINERAGQLAQLEAAIPALKGQLAQVEEQIRLLKEAGGQEEPEEPEDPEDPGEPGDPEDPGQDPGQDEPEDPNQPDEPDQPGGPEDPGGSDEPSPDPKPDPDPQPGLEPEPRAKKTLAKGARARSFLAGPPGQGDQPGPGALAKLEAQAQALRKQISVMEGQVSRGKAAIQEGQKEINRQAARLRAGQAELDAGLREIRAGQAKIAQGRRDLAKAQEELKAGKTELALQEAQLEAAKRELEEARKKLDVGKEDLAEAERKIREGEAALAQGRRDLAKAQDKVLQGTRDLEEGRSSYQAGLKDWKAGQSQLARAQTQGQARLDEARRELDEGWSDYREGQAEFEEEEAKAQEEIKEGEADLAQARDLLTILRKPAYSVNPRHEEYSIFQYMDYADRVDMLSLIFPVFFFAIALLLSSTTMNRLVDEERVQIGTYKALGYSRGSIALKYILFGVIAAIVGGILGIASGNSLLAYLIAQAYSTGFEVTPLAMEFYPIQAGLALGLAILSTGLVAYVSVRRTLKENVASLMRPKAPKKGNRIFLERLSPIWSRMSFLHKVTARNIFRYKKRMIMTILGVVGCVALLVLGFGIQTAVDGLGYKQYEVLTRYDSMLVYEKVLDREVYDDYKESLAEDERIEAFATGRVETLQASYADGLDQTLTLLVPESQEDFKEVVTLRDRSSQKELSLEEGEVIITEKLAQILDLEPGDGFMVEDEEKHRHELTVTKITEGYAGHYAYMTPGTYEEVLGHDYKDNVDLVQVKEAYKDDLREVLADYRDLDIVLASISLDQFKVLIDQLTESIGLIVIIIVIASTLLAMVVLYNLTDINIHERYRELSTIKVLGFYPKELTAYVYRETGTLTIIGILIGLGVGRLLHYGVLQVVVPDMAMLDPVLEPLNYLIPIGITLLINLAVMAMVHRRLKNIDMVEALKAVE